MVSREQAIQSILVTEANKMAADNDDVIGYEIFRDSTVVLVVKQEFSQAERLAVVGRSNHFQAVHFLFVPYKIDRVSRLEEQLHISSGKTMINGWRMATVDGEWQTTPTL